MYADSEPGDIRTRSSVYCVRACASACVRCDRYAFVASGLLHHNQPACQPGKCERVCSCVCVCFVIPGPRSRREWPSACVAERARKTNAHPEEGSPAHAQHDALHNQPFETLQFNIYAAYRIKISAYTISCRSVCMRQDRKIYPPVFHVSYRIRMFYGNSRTPIYRVRGIMRFWLFHHGDNLRPQYRLALASDWFIYFGLSNGNGGFKCLYASSAWLEMFKCM